MVKSTLIKGIFVTVMGLGFAPWGGAAPVGSETQIFANAVSLCREPNNIYVNGLKALGGDVFENLKIEGEGTASNPATIEAEVWTCPICYNSLIRAPNFYLGKVRLQFGYRQGRILGEEILDCQLVVEPAEKP